VLPLRDAIELPRPWLGERELAVARASSLGDAQLEEYVPFVRRVARGLGYDGPDARRVDLWHVEMLCMALPPGIGSVVRTLQVVYGWARVAPVVRI
jgi:hypothetical protein